MLPSVFDASDKDRMGFNALPAGWYEAEITKTDIRETRAKNGKYLSLEFTITETGYNGRKVWANLNLVNPSQVAVEIAEKELATICDAVGLDTIEDSEELHGIPLGIKLTIRPESAQWPERNEIKGYCKIDELNEKASGGSDSSISPF
jgi:hypothetical protein